MTRTVKSSQTGNLFHEEMIGETILKVNKIGDFVLYRSVQFLYIA